MTEAKAICEPCPVRSECLAFALADPHTKGIWGTSERERMRLRTERRRSA